MLADEEAHKMLMSLKGAAGTRFCITCRNVTNNLTPDPRGYIQSIECVDTSLFDQITDSDFFDCIDFLRRAKNTKSKKDFALIEQALGINFDADSLPFDDELRPMLKPVSGYLRDWMHTLCSHGTACSELALIMAKLKAEGVTLQQVRDYAMCFTLPKWMPQPSKEWWAEERFLEASVRNASAAENLTMLPLLLAFCEDVGIPARLRDNVSCLRLSCQILQLLRMGADKACSRVDELQSLIEKRARLFVALYPGQAKPKFHHLFHIVENMRETGKLMSCWVTERKHRTLKQLATCNFSSFELQVTQQVITRQLEASSATYHPMGMLSPSNLSGCEVLFSTRASLEHGMFHAGDVVALKDGRAGRLLSFHCLVSNRKSISATLNFYENLTPTTWSTASAGASLIDASLIDFGVAWAPKARDVIRVLLF
jgi:hypothetical protein